MSKIYKKLIELKTYTHIQQQQQQQIKMGRET